MTPASPQRGEGEPQQHMKKSKPCVVLGNGPSRRALDPLTQIPWDTFGSNSIIEEFTPTYLLFGDRWALREMAACEKPFQKPPPKHERYAFGSCGGASFYSACSMGYDPIYMIGFDGDAAGHTHPGWGMRRNRRYVAPSDLTSRWGRGFLEAWELFDKRQDVYLLGDAPSYLDAIFGRAPLKPWL